MGPGSDNGEGALLDHLVAAGLAGPVATGARWSLDNCGRLVAGDPDYTFGLSDWRDATYQEVVAAVRAAGGTRLGLSEDDPDEGYIDPPATLAGIRAHRNALAEFVAAGGGRVLLATGHPFALLPHYGALARALADKGCALLHPLEGQRDRLRTRSGRPCSIRYLDHVAALAYDGALHHTHRADYMEALLDEVGGSDGVDLAVGDHGFAGAAIEAGIATLSIADVNDPALPLAQARGRTAAVLLIDDGLEPSLFRPVTEAMLDWGAESQAP
ncbi:MAG: phosphatase [Actinomycetota bacterium]|nr:phosphatase [Actinomycetota bacterium]